MPDRVSVVSNLHNVDELIGRLRQVDYVVACDSGPAHLTKLLGLPGFAIYTAVAASVVQGSFRNLGTWQATYRGSYCAAPCGLVGLMATRDTSRYGCMDTLRAERATLIRPARIPDAEVRRFLLEKPVGCIAAVARDSELILAAILADIDQRSTRR